MNINSPIKTVLNKVNSKGASLLRKDLGLAINQAQKEGISIPNGSKIFDAVRIGRNFNPKESYTDIFTFRDGDGRIINRYIKTVDKNHITETKTSYEDLSPWEIDLDEFGENIMEIFGRRKRSFTRENGKISQISETFTSASDEKNPIVTIFKRIIKPNNRGNIESISIEQNTKGVAQKFIKNEYDVDTFGHGYFSLTKSEASSPELNNIAQNTYFLPFISPKSQFVHRMADACVQDAEMIVKPEIQVYKDKSRSAGFFSPREQTVNINLKTPFGLNTSRETLTETIGHEIGHSKWTERVFLHEVDPSFDLAKNEIKEVERYGHSMNHYIPSEKDHKAYSEQFCEQVARREGTAAKTKYNELKESLSTEFPKTHEFQFYQPDEYEDDLFDFMKLMVDFHKTKGN